MNSRKHRLLAVVRGIAALREPFGIQDVARNLDESFCPTYIANCLYELSIGAYPSLRCLSKGSIDRIEWNYISAAVKPPKRKPPMPGMAKDIFHALYGCFGVNEVLSRGLCTYDKRGANLIRKTVHVYVAHQKPPHRELIVFLKALAKKHSRYQYRSQHISAQSIKIGIIHALQSHSCSPDGIAGILTEVFGDWATKTQTKEARLLRENAASLRRNLSK